MTTSGTPPVRIGVIGLGEVGAHHARGVTLAAGAQLAAVADFNPDLRARAARDYPIATVFETGEALIADAGLDAVVIAIPHKFHCETAVAALRSRLHVLVEKPLATSVLECDRMIDAAKDADRILACSHNQLFYAPHAEARRLIDTGELTPPHLVRLRLSIAGKLGGWRADPTLTGGGILFDAGVHRIYVARHLLGEVATVQAWFDTKSPRTEGENLGLVMLVSEDNRAAVIDVGYHAPPGVFDDQVDLVSSSALVRIPGCEAHFERFSSEADMQIFKDGAWKSCQIEPDDWIATIHKSVANFVDALAGQAPVAVPGGEARRTIEIIEAAYRSAHEQSVVSISRRSQSIEQDGG